MAGPFNPFITPIIAKIHWDARKEKWVVKVSRQIEENGGAKYENTSQSFVDYPAALSFISVFWGNA